ncbi:STAS domain-containing protein [Ottowia thiooxydans]|uniref:STAS domain-containing protein n=1 Tax=Ottowia thiooxydans TaxID=219182 RepID=UPI000410F9D0|nr:STAS domain-containing protein [Ottowia thiooxydans]
MIAHEALANARLVSFTGQLNSGNAASAENDILGLITQGDRKLVLDFTNLDYISSAGLRVVLVTAKRLKPEGGHMVLFGMQPQVREIFDISGFLNILNVVETREQAIARFDA